MTFLKFTSCRKSQWSTPSGELVKLTLTFRDTAATVYILRCAVQPSSNTTVYITCRKISGMFEKVISHLVTAEMGWSSVMPNDHGGIDTVRPYNV